MQEDNFLLEIIDDSVRGLVVGAHAPGRVHLFLLRADDVLVLEERGLALYELVLDGLDLRLEVGVFLFEQLDPFWGINLLNGLALLEKLLVVLVFFTERLKVSIQLRNLIAQVRYFSVSLLNDLVLIFTRVDQLRLKLPALRHPVLELALLVLKLLLQLIGLAPQFRVQNIQHLHFLVPLLDLLRRAVLLES